MVSGYPLGWTRHFYRRRLGHIRKDNHHHSPQGFRAGHRLDDDVHDLRAAVGAHFHILERDGYFLPDRLVKSFAQRIAQTLTGHGKEIPVGLTRRWLEVFARFPANIENITLVGDEYRRR